MLELQTPVRQLAETIVEILVDRSGVDHLLEGNEILHVTVIRVEHDLDVGMIEHVFEHAREPIQGHGLIAVREIAIVAVGASGHARRHLRVEFGRIERPLLARVTTEKFLVEFAPDFADDDILARADHVAFLSHRGEEFLHLKRRQAQPVHLVDRIEIDRDR